MGNISEVLVCGKCSRVGKFDNKVSQEFEFADPKFHDGMFYTIVGPCPKCGEKMHVKQIDIKRKKIYFGELKSWKIVLDIIFE